MAETTKRRRRRRRLIDVTVERITHSYRPSDWLWILKQGRIVDVLVLDVKAGDLVLCGRGDRPEVWQRGQTTQIRPIKRVDQ